MNSQWVKLSYFSFARADNLAQKLHFGHLHGIL
jgi:hypothetical protein